MPLDPDLNELIFRVLFSSIFLGLGASSPRRGLHHLFGAFLFRGSFDLFKVSLFGSVDGGFICRKCRLQPQHSQRQE